MKYKTFATSRFAALLTKLFGGDKQFEVRLVRSETKPAEGEHPSQWRWAVDLPLGNHQAETLFAALIMQTVQVDDPAQSAAVVIRANPTNVGTEVGFEFVNASFVRHGKRKLYKAFRKLEKSWLEAKEATKCAFELLTNEVVQQVSVLARRKLDLLNNLEVEIRRWDRCSNCGKFHDADVAMLGDLVGVKVHIPGVVTLYDEESMLMRSGFGRAVQSAVREEAIAVIKWGMAEYMNVMQQRLLTDVPEELLHRLELFVEQQELMKLHGIEIEVDPVIQLLMSTLESFKHQAAEARSPGILLNFQILDRDANQVGSVSFNDKVLKIGSGETCHLRIEDDGVDHFQAVIDQDEGQIWLISMGHSHQTMVNGKLVVKVALKDGDVIGIGSEGTTIKVTISDKQDGVVTAAPEVTDPMGQSPPIAGDDSTSQVAAVN